MRMGPSTRAIITSVAWDDWSETEHAAYVVVQDALALRALSHFPAKTEARTAPPGAPVSGPLSKGDEATLFKQ